MVTGQTDEELMLRYRDGDAAAFETLYRRYERPLFDFIYRMAPNAADSESLFQETFLRLVGAKERYRATARFRTWLFQIAVNLCRDRARRMKHRAHLSLNDPVFSGNEGRGDAQSLVPDPSAPVGTSVEAGELEAAVKGAVGALPEDERAVVVLKEYQELSYPEIAEILGRPVGTLKSVHHRACERLKGSLAPYLGV
jgi:RNA polymerase sigma-70 factor (ECF subfamily)